MGDASVILEQCHMKKNYNCTLIRSAGAEKLLLNADLHCNIQFKTILSRKNTFLIMYGSMILNAFFFFLNICHFSAKKKKKKEKLYVSYRYGFYDLLCTCQ